MGKETGRLSLWVQVAPWCFSNGNAQCTGPSATDKPSESHVCCKSNRLDCLVLPGGCFSHLMAGSKTLPSLLCPVFRHAHTASLHIALPCLLLAPFANSRAKDTGDTPHTAQAALLPGDVGGIACPLLGSLHTPMPGGHGPAFTSDSSIVAPDFSLHCLCQTERPRE